MTIIAVLGLDPETVEVCEVEVPDLEAELVRICHTHVDNLVAHATERAKEELAAQATPAGLVREARGLGMQHAREREQQVQALQAAENAQAEAELSIRVAKEERDAAQRDVEALQNTVAVQEAELRKLRPPPAPQT